MTFHRRDAVMIFWIWISLLSVTVPFRLAAVSNFCSSTLPLFGKETFTTTVIIAKKTQPYYNILSKTYYGCTVDSNRTGLIVLKLPCGRLPPARCRPTSPSASLSIHDHCSSSTCICANHHARPSSQNLRATISKRARRYCMLLELADVRSSGLNVIRSSAGRLSDSGVTRKTGDRLTGDRFICELARSTHAS